LKKPSIAGRLERKCKALNRRAAGEENAKPSIAGRLRARKSFSAVRTVLRAAQEFIEGSPVAVVVT